MMHLAKVTKLTNVMITVGWASHSIPVPGTLPNGSRVNYISLYNTAVGSSRSKQEEETVVTGFLFL